MKTTRTKFNNNSSTDSRENYTTASTSNQIVGDHHSSTKSNAKVGLEASSSFTGEIRSTTTHEKFVNGESSLEKRKVHGPTRNLKLVKLPHGMRFEVSWRKKRPVGNNDDIFKSECTILARQVNFTPLQVKS